MALSRLRAAPTQPRDGYDALPAELGAALLSLATSAVPIRLVSRLAAHLARALRSRQLADAQVVLLTALLTRAAGPWLPTPHRFRQLAVQTHAILVQSGCTPADADAVVADLTEAFRTRFSQERESRAVVTGTVP